jgi:hypothetical protein
MMQSFLEVISAGWVGTSVGVIGIAIGILLYRRSRLSGMIAFQRDGHQLIGHVTSKLREVTVAYRGDPVPRVTGSKVAIWNAGTSTIKGSDIVLRDPLRVEIERGERILAAWIAVASRDVNAFHLDLQPDKAEVALCTFDFLDPNDGVIIVMLHTSPSEIASLRGTIRGHSHPFRDSGRLREAEQPFSEFVKGAPRWARFGIARLVWIVAERSSIIGALALGVAGISIMVGFVGGVSDPILDLQITQSWFWIGIGSLYLIFGLHALRRSWRRLPRTLRITPDPVPEDNSESHLQPTDPDRTH